MNTGSKTKKCGNKPFWFDPVTGQSYPSGSDIPLKQKERMEHWDSLLEFRTYHRLCILFPRKNIQRQTKIQILPKTDLFPELNWVVDFTVVDGRKTHLIEVKGKWITHDYFGMSDFCKLLRLLKEYQPICFHNLCIVSDTAWKIGTTKLAALPLSALKYEYFHNELQQMV